jgi:signal-transduction protein with cAMP-binding, CBS, and nucleotidyltransferase domain
METAKKMVEDKGQEIVSVPVGTTLFATLEKMNQKKVGSVLVTKDEKIVGIWTERDLMQDVIQEGFDLKSALIEEHMTTHLISAPHIAMLTIPITCRGCQKIIAPAPAIHGDTVAMNRPGVDC